MYKRKGPLNSRRDIDLSKNEYKYTDRRSCQGLCFVLKFYSQLSYEVLIVYFCDLLDD